MRRHLIERTALRLFAERSIAEVSVRDIAEAAGIGESGLYRHMKSKEELAARVFLEAYGELAQEMAESITVATGFMPRIEALAGVVLDAYDRDPILLRFLLLLRHHDNLTAVEIDPENPVDILRGVVSDGIAAGEVLQMHPDLATAILMGIVLQPLTFSLYGRVDIRGADLKAPLCAAISRALSSGDAQ